MLWVAVGAGGMNISEGALELESSTEPKQLDLLMQRKSFSDEELPDLESAWLQSWIANGTQQDRAVFRFRSSGANALVQLDSKVTFPVGFK